MSSPAVEFAAHRHATVLLTGLSRQVPMPTSDAWASHPGQEPPAFAALRAALRRSVRQQDIRLAVHKVRPQLRVSLGSHHIDVVLDPGAHVKLRINTGGGMELTHPGPSSDAELDAWAGRLAQFIVRRLQS